MTEPNEDNTGWRKALRRDMVARRAALSTAEHTDLSTRIVEHLLRALPAPRSVAFCWPIKHEPDVRPALEQWVVAGTRAALPVVVAEAQPLVFREWHANSVLEPDRYGIPTPKTGELLLPDVILLPLNGFDDAGYRLGYGGGYFDRTLVALQPRPLAVGIGFEINRLPSIRPEIHDQRLDWLITEAGAWSFRPA